MLWVMDNNVYLICCIHGFPTTNRWVKAIIVLTTYYLLGEALHSMCVCVCVCVCAQVHVHSVCIRHSMKFQNTVYS